MNMLGTRKIGGIFDDGSESVKNQIIENCNKIPENQKKLD